MPLKPRNEVSQCVQRTTWQATSAGPAYPLTGTPRHRVSCNSRGMKGRWLTWRAMFARPSVWEEELEMPCILEEFGSKLDVRAELYEHAFEHFYDSALRGGSGGRAQCCLTVIVHRDAFVSSSSSVSSSSFSCYSYSSSSSCSYFSSSFTSSSSSSSSSSASSFPPPPTRVSCV
jgi:hypothetical protein